MEPLALEARRRLIDFVLPPAPELVRSDRLPAALLQLIGGEITPLQRTMQFEPRDPRTVVGQQAARRHQETDAVRTSVAQRAVPQTVDAVVFVEPRQRQRLQRLGDLQLEQMGRRPRERVGAKQSIRQDLEALDRDGLDPEIERAGLPCSIDPCFDQRQELIEDRVLQRDRQREDAVEPALDGGKVIDHAAIMPFDP